MLPDKTDIKSEPEEYEIKQQEMDQTTMGPWFCYILRPIPLLEEEIFDTVNQLKESTTFLSIRNISTYNLEISGGRRAGQVVIKCIAKRRRNGERWEYKLTNDSRREFLRECTTLEACIQSREAYATRNQKIAQPFAI
jgi:hypothetical protein